MQLQEHTRESVNNKKKNNKINTHIGGKKFCIPTVTSIMCHFIKHVLSKADLLWVSSNLQQEQVHSAKKVTHGLGTNDFLSSESKQIEAMVKGLRAKWLSRGLLIGGRGVRIFLV